VISDTDPQHQPRRLRRKRDRARREPLRWASPQADAALGVVLGLVVLGSVLALGSVHLPVLVVVAAGALVAAGVALRGGAGWNVPAVVCLALSGYTVLQAVPLPARVVGRIAPANLAIWQRSTALLREPVSNWIPISLDPSATWVESLKWGTYALVFVAAAALAQRRGALWGFGIVFASSVVAGLATVGHGLLGATKVFGVYEPLFTPAPWHIGPLINPNNLSGYLTLGTLAGLGLVLSRNAATPAWLVGLGVATNVGVNVTAASRAGALALPFGILVLGVALLRQRRHGSAEATLAGRSARWLVLAALVGGGALGILGATTDTWRELWDQNVEKLGAIVWVLPLLKQHAWVGVGRGAFESVFPAYRNAPGNTVFTHAESFPADWAAGWGAPVAVLALGLFAWALRPSAVGVRRSALAAAGWAAVLAVLLQNLADLGMEVPALPIAVAVVWGSLLGARARIDGAGARSPSDSRAPAAMAFGAGALLVLATLRWGGADLATQRQRLHDAVGTSGESPVALAALRSEVRAAVRRHPAEPYFPLVGALLAWKARDENPMPWISWSLERDLTNGRAHLLAAEVVATRGARHQALLELRLALSDDAELAPAAMRLAVRLKSSCDELLALAPDGESGGSVLCAIVAPDWAPKECRQRLVSEAVARAPSARCARTLAASAVLDRLRSEADQTCAGERRAACEQEVLEHARMLERAEPKLSTAVQFRAQLMRTQGKSSEAEQLLRDQCHAYDDREGCHRARVELAASLQPPSALGAAIRDYVAAACARPGACADANTQMGDLLSARGDLATAVTYYERATRERPTEASWNNLAIAASRAGAHAQAAAALEKVAQLRGKPDAELTRRIDEERSKALGLR